MKFHVIDSSTKGFCYAITGKDEALIIEAGIKPDQVWQAVNFDLKKVAGCLVSNPSNLVCKFAREFGEDMNLFSNAETIKYLNLAHFDKVKAIKAGETYQVGNFIVKPFELRHPIKNYGYFINHAETGRIIYMTNTNSIPYKFDDVNHIIIECHYTDEKLLKNIKDETIRPILGRRISEGHLSFETLSGWLKVTDLSKTKNIVLCNLSDKNSEPERFKEGIMLGTKINTEIAVKGLTIDLQL